MPSLYYAEDHDSTVSVVCRGQETLRGLLSNAIDATLSVKVSSITVEENTFDHHQVESERAKKYSEWEEDYMILFGEAPNSKTA